MHSSVNDTTGVVHRWVLDYELAFLNEERFRFVTHFMQNWWWLSLVYALFYIIIVFIGQAWMSKRNNKFELRRPLVLWNTILTIFSFWGACRTVPELIRTLTDDGFMHSICVSDYMRSITGVWVFLFTLSKVPETIDTLFIVLRRQQLIFLHWYHHASVLVYCFYTYPLLSATGRWYVAMNYCVHTIMYGYFALRAARIRMPSFVQQTITLLQLIQMISGCIVNIVAFKRKQDGHYCDAPNDITLFGLALYTSYLLLFAHFFYTTYLRKDSKSKNKTRVD